MRPNIFRQSRILLAFASLAFILSGIIPGRAADLRITSIRTTNNDVRLTWNAPGGSNYILQTVTPLSSNFVDLGPTNFVPTGADQSLSFTNLGARTSALSRFYRVKSFPPPRLEIQPTNSIIAPGMTNRYKMLFVSSDNVTNDVTASASLSVMSLTPTVAQFLRITNGFATVRAVAVGTAPIRAVYQGMTNSVNLTVAAMTGMNIVPPLPYNGYIGDSRQVQVMGTFAGGQTRNITPASDLGGGAACTTRVDYNIRRDVANSFALVTGQSAANGDIMFTGGTNETMPAFVTWCEYTDVGIDYISLRATSSEIGVGQFCQFSVRGYDFESGSTTVPSSDITSFVSSDDTIAQADQVALRVKGVTNGTVSIYASTINSAGCAAFYDIFTLTVTNVFSMPIITNQPANQFAILGQEGRFNFTVGGSASLAFQWYFNGALLSGNTNQSLALSNVSLLQEGNYRVAITNVYGAVTSSVATLTVVPAGLVLWTNRYNGPGNFDDYVRAVAVDNNGNVFMTGDSSSDYATIKYSGAGVGLWTNRYNGPNGATDSARAIAVDGNGSVFVTGDAGVSGGTTDYATIKYSNAGVPLWTNRYNGTGNSGDFAAAVAVNSNGVVFVTGNSRSASFGGSEDFATVAYSNAGVPLWTNRYNGPGSSGSSHDIPSAIAVDSSGNVFVTGRSKEASSSFYDFATIKYSAGGVPLWTNRFGSFGDDEPAAMAVDSAGNVFITGFSSAGAGRDFSTIKYSNSGVILWTNRYNGPANGSDFPKALALDTNGNVFVTGSADSTNSLRDFLTIKYSNSGVPLWTNQYNGAGESFDTPLAMVVDRSGNAVVTGVTTANGFANTYATIKYSGDGGIIWLNRYRSGVLPSIPFQAMAVDSNDSVFVVESHSFLNFDYFLQKY